MTLETHNVEHLVKVYTQVAERFLPAIKARLQGDPYIKMLQGFGVKIEIEEALIKEIEKFVLSNPLMADINASMMCLDLQNYLAKSNIKL